MLEFTTVAPQTNISVDVTQPRQTPLPPERRFAEALAEGISAVVEGAAAVAATAVPGAPIMSAAVREISGRPFASGDVTVAAGGTGERPEAPGARDLVGTGGGSVLSDYWRLQLQSQNFNLQFLQLQEALSQENRRFSALSNILKARHDTSKAVIQNIR